MKHDLNNKPLVIEKRDNFNVPAGLYRGAVKEVFEQDKPYKGETDTTLRIKWRVLDPVSPFFEYVVAKSYPYSLRQHSKLWKDLVSWLGMDGLQRLIPTGVLNPESLKGLEADVEVVHINNGHEQPYVYVKRITPPGELTRGAKHRTAPIIPAPVITSFQANVR